NTETLGYLTLLQNTTISSGSQNQYLINTLKPYSKPDFLRLVDPLLIPNLLLYVGPNRRKEYLLYNNMVHNDWSSDKERLLRDFYNKEAFRYYKLYPGRAGQRRLRDFSVFKNKAPGLSKIIRITRLAPSKPLIPSAKTIRRRLHSILSLTLNCWTLPYNQIFMILEQYQIKDQIYRITTDNSLLPNITIIRILCLTYVIQLSLNKLLRKLKQYSIRFNIWLYTLIPVLNVNSTFLMLRRAKQIRLLFKPFCKEYNYTEILLTNDK
ncbi:hypothetical protein N7509_006465, partial [Penicillium cosmopolitanum]